MMTKVGAGGAGSCGGLVEYLEKENKLKPEQQAELWFSQSREQGGGQHSYVMFHRANSTSKTTQLELTEGLL